MQESDSSPVVTPESAHKEPEVQLSPVLTPRNEEVKETSVPVPDSPIAPSAPSMTTRNTRITEPSEPTVYLPKEITAKHIEFKPPVKRSSSFFVEIGYKGENMYIQTNKIRVVSSSAKFARFDLDQDLFDLLSNVDNCVKSVCVKNSKDFFKGKTISREQVEYGYKSPIQANGYNSGYSSIFVTSGTEKVQIYNSSLQPVSLNSVSPSDYAKVLLKMSGVNITPREIQPVWEIVQLKTYAKSSISRPFFVDVDSDMISQF